MRKMNRFIIVLATFTVALGVTVLYSSNIYINAAIIYCALLLCVACFSYILEHPSKNEEKFADKISELFDID